MSLLIQKIVFTVF